MGERLPAKAAENWDLHAVVRRFSSAVDTAATTTTKNFAQEVNTADENSCSENPLSFMATMKFEEEDDPFSFPNLLQTRNNGFEELQNSYKPFFATPNSSSSVPGGLTGHQQQQRLTASTSINPPASPTSSSPPFVFREPKSQQTHHVQQDLQQHPQIQQQQRQQQPLISSVLPLRPMPSQASRSRKRKVPQKRVVCHVTAENLSADMWAWRKYGQKPIKGSPYPRNYYRCSSSKGCAARKQVERNNTDPNIYIISYTGDHTHPLPTHRNSLAGSTRNKFSKTQNPADSSNCELKVKVRQSKAGDNASSTSPLSATCHSPTASVAPVEEEKESEERDSKEFEEDDDDLDNLLIPNLAAAFDEDFFNGLKDFGTSAASGSGGD